MSPMCYWAPLASWAPLFALSSFASVWPFKRKGSKQVNGPMKLKGPTEVTFKHGGGQENFRSLSLRNLSAIRHFQNDWRHRICVHTSPDPVSISVTLELKRSDRKGSGGKRMRVLIKTNVPHPRLRRLLSSHEKFRGNSRRWDIW